MQAKFSYDLSSKGEMTLFSQLASNDVQIDAGYGIKKFELEIASATWLDSLKDTARVRFVQKGAVAGNGDCADGSAKIIGCDVLPAAWCADGGKKFDARNGQAATNRRNIPLQEKFHRGILEGVRNISGTLQNNGMKLPLGRAK
jgi:hypothetical protein